VTRRGWLLLALALLGCDGPEPARDPSVGITPLRLPPVALERSDGTNAVLRERPTVLHFWATWCAPCRRELPGLLRLADETEGVEVIAVTDEPWRAVRGHFAPDPVPAAVARDAGGELSRAIGVRSLPDTYAVDADGVARRRVAGSRDWTDDALRAWVASRR